MKTRFGKKVYPLTNAQKLLYGTILKCPGNQVPNIGTSLTIEQELDWNTLKTAIYQAYERCDSMRLRFIKDKDGTVYQYVADKEEREIPHFDFTGWQECHAVDKMEEWTKTPFTLWDSPLNRIVMIKTPDGYQGLYLLVHHMTMDAQSLIGFMRDVIEIYCSMKYEGIDYPKPLAAYIEQLKKDLAYQEGSSAQRRDREFFEKLIGESEPIYNDVEGPQRLEEEREKYGDKNLRAYFYNGGSMAADIRVFHLEAEPTSRLLRFCEEKQVPMVCLLMMALRTYLQKVNGNEDVSLTTTIARRATLMEKKSGGTRIHCFPFRTVVSPKATFMEGIALIRQEQNKYFRHASYDPMDFYQARARKYPTKNQGSYESMSLTYQPLTLKEKGLEKLGDIRYKTAWYTNGEAAHNLYLTVMHRASDNGLDFSFEYQTDFISGEKLEYVYYYLCKILFAGIARPDSTVGEIMESV